MKAGLINEAADYTWSSYQEFLGEPKLVETDFVLGLFDGDRGKALEQFKAFHAVEGEVACLEIDEKKRWKDHEAVELVKTVCQVAHCKEVQTLNKEKQSECLKRLRAEGLSARQVGHTQSN